MKNPEEKNEKKRRVNEPYIPINGDLGKEKFHKRFHLHTSTGE